MTNIQIAKRESDNAWRNFRNTVKRLGGYIVNTYPCFERELTPEEIDRLHVAEHRHHIASEAYINLIYCK